MAAKAAASRSLFVAAVCGVWTQTMSVGLIPGLGSRPVEENPQPEGFGAAGDGLADLAVADEAERLAGEEHPFPAPGLETVAFPVAAPDIAVAFGDMAGGGKDKAEGGVGGRFGEGVRRVRGPDAASEEGLAVEVVGADGDVPDDAELRRGREEFVVDPEFADIDHGHGIADGGEDIRARHEADGILRHLNRGHTNERGEVIEGQLVGDEDAHFETG
jgi:hypothetical protein